MNSATKRTSRHLYALAFLILLGLNTAIFFFLDGFLRGILGDVLVVAQLYALVQWVARRRPEPVLTAVLALAFAIEIGQALDYVRRLGLEGYPTVAALLGQTFSWGDFLAYLAGGGLVLLAERTCQTST